MLIRVGNSLVPADDADGGGYKLKCTRMPYSTVSCHVLHVIGYSSNFILFSSWRSFIALRLLCTCETDAHFNHFVSYFCKECCWQPSNLFSNVIKVRVNIVEPNINFRSMLVTPLDIMHVSLFLAQKYRNVKSDMKIKDV